MMEESRKKSILLCWLTVFNGTLICYGLASIGVGFWVRANPITNHVSPQFQGELWAATGNTKLDVTVVQLKGFLNIVEGFVIVILIVTACAGMGSQDATCYIGAYIISFVVTASFTILIFVKGAPTQWGDTVHQQLISGIEHKYDGTFGKSDHAFTRAFDGIQISGECCGVDSYLDYTRLNITQRPANETWKIPRACCKPIEGVDDHMSKTHFQNADACQNTQEAEYLWSLGCLDTVKGVVDMMYGVQASLALVGIAVQTMALVAVFVLCQGSK